MEVSSVETIRVAAHPNVIWVQVRTEDGNVGLGESWYGAAAIEAYVHDVLAARILGRDARNIEALNLAMTTQPQAQSSTGVEYRAASAIDIALWDILGKLTGQPVHVLLGGQSHERVRIYNTCAGPAYGGGRGKAGDFEDLHAFTHHADWLAEDLLESGISAMKIWPFDPIARETGGVSISRDQMKRGLEPFEKIRRAVGDRMDIMVEFHSMWKLPAAKQIARALEPYDPTWFEDPIRMNDPRALADYNTSTHVPVCAGETLGTRWPYRDMLEAGAIDIAMVDIAWTGGLTEARKIAALADTFHKPFAPHDCIGPVGLVAGVHTAISQPNAFIQETVRAYYRGWYADFVTELPRIADGHVYPMEGPGLGTQLQSGVRERDDATVRVSERA